MTAPWILVGCGYTGMVLARRLVARGTPVIVARRDAEAAAAQAASLGALATPRAIDLGEFPLPFGGRVGEGGIPDDSIVVVLAPPTPGCRGEAALAHAALRARRVVYVSSTSVYGPGGGALVDETWAPAPASPAGEARLAAETSLRAILADRLVILRAAAIYGPGRGVVPRLRAGTMRLVDGGRAMTSRVHVEDLAQAIELAGDAASPRPLYNVADREPSTTVDVATAAAAALGLASPPSVSSADLGPDLAAMMTGDRRIDARLLEQDLGWVPRFPTWRQGLAAELAAG